MKISVIITTMMVAQVSASFFDVFNGAVLSVQNSFGKLLSDVVTDVKDTVDCTILAVEHVLSLSHDATLRYYEKCGGVTNKTDSVSDAQQNTSFPKVEVTLNLSNNEEYLQKVVPAEINARINETLFKVLDNQTPHGNVQSMENVLAKESEQLAGVSVILKKELEKLSNEVTTDLKNIEKQRNSVPSLDVILQEIKVLEKREQNTKNTSEAYEIHKVIDQILGKLDAIKAIDTTENRKLEEILKDLGNYSNNSFMGLTHQFEEWKQEESKHLSEIKNKIEEHEIASSRLGLYNRNESDDTQPVTFKTDINRDGVELTLNAQESSGENTIRIKDTIDNSSSPRTSRDSNDKSLISVGNEPSSFINMTLKESELNDTVVTNTPFLTTENPFGGEIIRPFETPTSVGSIDIITLSTNQSVTLQNNLAGDNTNETTVNSTFSITDGRPLNETFLPVLGDTDKGESMPETINEPTTIVSAKNNSTETVIISNPVPATEISFSDISQPVPLEINTDRNNNTANTGAAERTETKLTSTAQDTLINDDVNATAITSISNTMVENRPVNSTDSKTLETSTSTTNELLTTLAPFKDIESNDTMIPRHLTSEDVNIPVNETGSLIDTVNVESPTVSSRTVGDNDTNRSNDSLITENTPVSETIRPGVTTSASSKGESLTGTMKIVDANDLNDTLKANSSLSIVENKTVGETTLFEETNATPNVEKSSTVTTTIIIDLNDSNNTTLTSDSLPIVKLTPVSDPIEPKETTTACGNEDSSNDSNKTMIACTSLLITESTPLSEASQAVANTTASSNMESLIETTTEFSSATNIENNNDSNDYIITTTPTPIISKFESDTIQAIDTTTNSTNENDSISSAVNNPTETLNTANDTDDATALVILKSIPLNDTSQAVANTTASSNMEFLIETTTGLSNTSNIVNGNDSNDHIITTTPTPIISKYESGAIQVIDTTTNSTSEKDSLSLAVNNPTETTDTANDTDDATALTISESIPKENTTTAQNDELLMTMNSPTVSTTTLIDTDSNTGYITIYGQAVMPPITRGVFNDDPEWLPSVSLFPSDPNQQTKVENDALQLPAFDAFDSTHERLLHSETPFGSKEDILKIPYMPSTPRPTRRASRANNHKTPPMNYDSFFQTPQKNSEAHQHALKEARQLIANSKRSARIINSIMKKKNKYNAKSIFDG